MNKISKNMYVVKVCGGNWEERWEEYISIYDSEEDAKDMVDFLNKYINYISKSPKYNWYSLKSAKYYAVPVQIKKTEVNISDDGTRIQILNR